MKRLNVIRFTYHKEFLGYYEIDGIFCVFYITDFTTYLLPEEDEHIGWYFYEKFHAFITHDPKEIQTFVKAHTSNTSVTAHLLRQLGTRPQISSRVPNEAEANQVANGAFIQILNRATEDAVWN